MYVQATKLEIKEGVDCITIQKHGKYETISIEKSIYGKPSYDNLLEINPETKTIYIHKTKDQIVDKSKTEELLTNTYIIADEIGIKTEVQYAITFLNKEIALIEIQWGDLYIKEKDEVYCLNEDGEKKPVEINPTEIKWVKAEEIIKPIEIIYKMKYNRGVELNTKDKYNLVFVIINSYIQPKSLVTKDLEAMFTTRLVEINHL